MTRWPLCLHLPTAEGDLALPAALVEQVLPCDPLALAPNPEPGWHEEGESPGGALLRVRFVAAGDGPRRAWSACWIAVLRRVGSGATRRRRHGLLLCAAPRLLAPLDDGVEVLPGAPGRDAVAALRSHGQRLVVPDVARLMGAGGAA